MDDNSFILLVCGGIIIFVLIDLAIVLLALPKDNENEDDVPLNLNGLRGTCDSHKWTYDADNKMYCTACKMRP